MECLLVLFALLSSGCCFVTHLSAYPFSTVLKADRDGNPLYTLHWNFSTADETVTFGVSVTTPPARMYFANRGGRETKVSFGVA